MHHRGTARHARTIDFVIDSCYVYEKGATIKTLTRFGVAFEDDLLRTFDRYIASAHYTNRSEALRDLVRSRLLETEVQNPHAKALGVLTMVYDHHQRELEGRLTEVQHHHRQQVISTTHVHIDDSLCLEVVLLKGSVQTIQDLSTAIAKFKGILHHNLTLTAAGSES
jgi:CopG family nickel-responsive transcriptional regulator